MSSTQGSDARYDDNQGYNESGPRPYDTNRFTDNTNSGTLHDLGTFQGTEGHSLTQGGPPGKFVGSTVGESAPNYQGVEGEIQSGYKRGVPQRQYAQDQSGAFGFVGSTNPASAQGTFRDNQGSPGGEFAATTISGSTPHDMNLGGQTEGDDPSRISDEQYSWNQSRHGGSCLVESPDTANDAFSNRKYNQGAVDNTSPNPSGPRSESIPGGTSSVNDHSSGQARKKDKSESLLEQVKDIRRDIENSGGCRN